MSINSTAHCLDKHNTYLVLATRALQCFLQAVHVKGSHSFDIMLQHTRSATRRCCLMAGFYIPVDSVPPEDLSVLGKVHMLWLTWTNFLIMPDLRRALESWRAEGRSLSLPGLSCRAVSWSCQPRAGSAVWARGLWRGWWGPAHRELCLLGPPEGP